MPNKKKRNPVKYEKQRVRTTANKIRRFERELRHNPNNISAKQVLMRLKNEHQRQK